MNLKYRADIDGLRAIAVLSVLLDHAGLSLFRGGYIGVDIFFVISGYLITGIIIREIEANNFSFARFYERRIRRIYPALFATLFSTILVCAILYDAGNFQDFGKSVVATTFFFSNINFWSETGYFDVTAQLKPLLHTWSLAVEEQYYIVFPLVMFFLARYFKSKIPYILFFVALGTFIWNIYTLQHDPSGAFYFAHLRAWELLIGGLLALNFISIKFKPVINNLLALIGIGMVVTPTFIYTATTTFPGFAAAIPVLGTALLIYCGIQNTSYINQFLSNPPLVFIGKISYSLYLWHWPIIIFSRYYAIKKLTPWELGGVILSTLLVATLSWKFIETPFREKKLLSRRGVFIGAAIMMLLIATIGSTIYLNKGFPTQQDLESARKGSRSWSLSCKIHSVQNKNTNNVSSCILGAEDQEPSFLLWGDSHARAVAEGISSAALKQNLSGKLIYSSGCAPLLHVLRDRKQYRCDATENVILEYVAEHPELRTIILSGRWALYAEASSYSFVDEELHFNIVDLSSHKRKKAPSNMIFEQGLERTVKELIKLNRKVVIINQIPEIGYDVPSANFIAQRTGRDTNKLIALPIENYYERNHNVFQAIDSISEKYNIRVVDPSKILCNQTVCLTAADNQPLYFDDHHLSVFGSMYITHIYDPIFQELAGLNN